MIPLAQRINLKFGIVENAYVIEDTLDIDPLATLRTICCELNINLSNVSESDFDYTAMILSDFCEDATDETGYTVSVWFD